VILWSLAERISAPFSALDLADPSSPQRIAEEIEGRRSLSGKFLSDDPRQEQAEVEGECAGAGRSHASLWQSNAARGKEALNAISNAGFQSLPYMATYAATKAFILHFSGPYIASSPQEFTRNGNLPGSSGDQFLRWHLHQHSAKNMDNSASPIRRTLEAFAQKRVVADPGRISVRLASWLHQTASSKSCRLHRRDGNGQYRSPSLMVLCRRRHSCLSAFGVDHVVKPSVSDKLTLSPCANFRVSSQPRAPQLSQCGVENGLPYRCLSFEDRSSSDKTLPRYSVRAFLYSAMIRGFSFGPASE
jgi:uncharacterized protein